MAKKKRAQKKPSSPGLFTRMTAFFKDPTTHTIFGLAVLFFALALFSASISFLINWRSDFSLSDQPLSELLQNPETKAHNIFGNLGFALAYSFVYKWFGISALLLAAFIGMIGMRITFMWKGLALLRFLRNAFFWVFWFMVTISFFAGEAYSVYAGGIGFYTNKWLLSVLGTLGTAVLLLFALLGFVAIRFKLTPNRLNGFLPKKKDRLETPVADSKPEEIATEPKPIQVDFDKKDEHLAVKEPKPTQEVMVHMPENEDAKPELNVAETDLEITVEEKPKEEVVSEKEINKKVKEFGEYDPKLDLSKFKLPTIDLLIDYGQSNITIDQDELEANKNRIVETLNNYKIDIAKIKATIGPTVTLYEIVPAAGVRISKIKNLEDDIALSLSALGIRIIAPIPGKGTIGIEVPNKKPQIVSMRQALASEKFQNAQMDLPIALGKTISNETMVADLAKMPHLLMAGATGRVNRWG